MHRRESKKAKGRRSVKKGSPSPLDLPGRVRDREPTDRARQRGEASAMAPPQLCFLSFFILCSLLSCSPSSSFYLPGVAPRDFKQVGLLSNSPPISPTLWHLLSAAEFFLVSPHHRNARFRQIYMTFLRLDFMNTVWIVL
jgi:hypothetical protein